MRECPGNAKGPRPGRSKWAIKSLDSAGEAIPELIDPGSLTPEVPKKGLFPLIRERLRAGSMRLRAPDIPHEGIPGSCTVTRREIKHPPLSLSGFSFPD